MVKDVKYITTIEGDLHDLLIIEMIKYFNASEAWETRRVDHASIAARNALARIRLLARDRRYEILEQRNEKYSKKKGESNE
jgi:hypothetical protein